MEIIKQSISYIKNNFWRILIVIIFVLLFRNILQSAIGMLTSSTIDEWRIGDWLINYQGGFVRRGLIGEIALQLSRLQIINVVAFTIIIQILLYLVFFMNTLRLALKSPFLPLNFALIFSPAFMLYPVFDPVGSFRKEIILFALLSSVCAHLAFSKKGISNGFLVLIGLSSVVMVLSHEMLVIYLPFLVCALILHEKGITVNTKKLVVALIPAILITIFIILFGKGNRHNVLDICNSLNLNTFSNCAKTGAIAFLGLDFKIAHEIVLEYSNSESRLVYILTAILSTLPIVIFVFAEKVVMFVNNRRMVFWLTFYILSTFISSLLFFWIAVDYGRLIYIPIACLSLLALLVISKRKEVTQKITAKSIIPWVLSLLFVTSWHLMHYLATINNSFPVIVTIRKLVTIIFHQ